jgi:D-beta-D-heptose 7-phosphate kinase/D-beta-D-heptose 1-phosphate adenosyltransferase
MENLIREFLDRCHVNSPNIHCLGDAMIDEYYQVKINRISPEYPVAVMLSEENVVTKPGGIANVAYQLKNTNSKVHLMTFYDENAFEFFYHQGLNPFYLGENAKLPIKRRFIDNGYQVAPRQDIEFKNSGLNYESIEEYYKITKKFIKSSPNPDAVILSDYNKGFFASEKNFIDLYENTITIVDPKSSDITKWKNCTIFKPNKKEAFELSGLSDWKDQCSYFTKELNCKAVIITDSGNGIKGCYQETFFEYNPPYISDVQSVIGAGDCFAAFLALASALGFNPVESSKIAYHAGLIYVKQKENRPIVLAEMVNNKIVRAEDLAVRDFSVALTNGCFDILHTGHIETLKFAKSKSDKLVVAVNTDESIRRIKGSSRPIVPLVHRMNVLANLSMVDFVVCFDENNPLEIIKIIKPDYLIKGADYKDKEIIGAEYAKEIAIAPFIEDFSTTKILKDNEHNS